MLPLDLAGLRRGLARISSDTIAPGGFGKLRKILSARCSRSCSDKPGGDTALRVKMARRPDPLLQDPSFAETLNRLFYEPVNDF
jgi:hypothetical protein